jgi:predicted nucleotidyltransferase
VVSHGRRLEVSAFIGRLEKWAADRDDVVAVAIVGSWAGDSAREDSDVDVVLLTDDVSVFLEADGWIAEFAPAAELIRKAEWGAIAERRLRLPSGLEIELGVGPPSWAWTAPVDAGTRAVVRDGLWPVFDPCGLLAELTAACRFES